MATNLVNKNKPIPDPVEVTQQAYDKMVEQVKNIKENILPDIMEKVKSSRAEGDLKENGGYHAAREAQKNALTKIETLEYNIKYAKIVESSNSKGIDIGNLIHIKMMGMDQNILIGNQAMGNAFDDIEFMTVDPSLPLAKAVLGHNRGDKTSYETNSGSKVDIEIIELLG